MKQKVLLSNYSLFISISGIAVYGALMIYEFRQSHDAAACFMALALVVLCGMSLFYTPMSLSVDNASLNINRSFRIKSIPLGEILSVKLCPPTMAEKRIFGSGGWFGYWGHFSEPSIGKYFAYYGKASDCFLVKLKDGKQYLLSCENPAQMVEYINSKVST